MFTVTTAQFGRLTQHTGLQTVTSRVESHMKGSGWLCKLSFDKSHDKEVGMRGGLMPTLGRLCTGNARVYEIRNDMRK